jgi:molybdate transport repressor ModE-like protein
MTYVLRSLRDVTLRQLRTLRAVAEAGSITGAARELHLTQPAVSMQIKELEDICGLALYERRGRGIVLTDAGRELAQTAAAVTETLRATQETLDAMRGIRTGVLRLAVVSTANSVVPQILSVFAGEYPDVTVQLRVGNRADVVDRLASNSCDLAIMGAPPSEVPTESAAFAEHPQVIVAAPDHPLAGRRRIRLEELARERFILREEGSGTRNAMENFFRERDFLYRPGMEASSNETIKQAVMAGMGISFISRHTISLELAAGRLIVLPVIGTPLKRSWRVIHRRGKRQSPTARVFREFLLRRGADCIAAALARPAINPA